MPQPQPQPQAQAEAQTLSRGGGDGDGGDGGDGGGGDARPGSPDTVTASFTADSPYFSSYVDREMHSLNVLHDTVKDISARAQTFGRCGGLMAEATRRLSQACHLQPSGGTSSGPRSPPDDRGADADPEARDRELALREQRRNAVGSEMESVLSVLGGVSSASERSGFWAC